MRLEVDKISFKIFKKIIMPLLEQNKGMWNEPFIVSSIHRVLLYSK